MHVCIVPSYPLPPFVYRLVPFSAIVIRFSSRSVIILFLFLLSLYLPALVFRFSIAVRSHLTRRSSDVYTYACSLRLTVTPRSVENARSK